MRRLLLAAFLAVALHGFLFTVRGSWLLNGRPLESDPRRPVSITLRTFTRPAPLPRAEEEKTEKPPREVPPKKTVKKTPPEKTPPTPKPKPKPKPEPRPRPEPKPAPSPEPEPTIEKTEEAIEEARVEPVDPRPRLPDFSEWVSEAPESPGETVPEPAVEEAAGQHASLGKPAPVPKPEVVEAVPMYKTNRPPEYPRIAERRGYEGTVFLEVLVTVEGRAAEVRVARSCGHRVLDKAALEAVKDWRFEPGRRGGEAVEMMVRIPLTFRLE